MTYCWGASGVCKVIQNENNVKKLKMSIIWYLIEQYENFINIGTRNKEIIVLVSIVAPRALLVLIIQLSYLLSLNK